MCKGGGTVWNTLKGGGTKKKGGETKILKSGDKLGQGLGALKRGGGGGAGTPLQTMKRDHDFFVKYTWSILLKYSWSVIKVYLKYIYSILLQITL